MKSDEFQKLYAKKPRRDLEHEAQSSLFRWAKSMEIVYPELAMMFAVPNGGHRHIRVATKLKAEGVKSGVPDIILAVAREDYHGFFFELKVGKNKPSLAQEFWAEALREQGYWCSWGDEAEAKKTITMYLRMRK